MVDTPTFLKIIERLHPDKLEEVKAYIEIQMEEPYLETIPEQVLLTENVDFETYWHIYAEEQTELTAGKVIVLPLMTNDHHEILSFLTTLIGVYVERTDAGRIYRHPFLMKHLPINYARKPDLMVVTTENFGKRRETYVDGAADLVVEVVSERSIKRDREEKYGEYLAAGVREYWMVDPINQEILFYVLNIEDQERSYQRVQPDKYGIYTSTVLPLLNFKASLALQQPVPNILEAFRLVDEMLAE